MAQLAVRHTQSSQAAPALQRLAHTLTVLPALLLLLRIAAAAARSRRPALVAAAAIPLWAGTPAAPTATLLLILLLWPAPWLLPAHWFLPLLTLLLVALLRPPVLKKEGRSLMAAADMLPLSRPPLPAPVAAPPDWHAGAATPVAPPLPLATAAPVAPPLAPPLATAAAVAPPLPTPLASDPALARPPPIWAALPGCRAAAVAAGPAAQEGAVQGVVVPSAFAGHRRPQIAGRGTWFCPSTHLSLDRDLEGACRELASSHRSLSEAHEAARRAGAAGR